MTDNTSTLRLWFMDWHSWMLDHDPVRDTFARHRCEPGFVPGLSGLVPLPFGMPCRPVLEKRVSMPRPFPELEMQELPHNRVMFFRPQTETYLRSIPFRTTSVDYDEVKTPREWEHFFPMTADMMRGLSILIGRNTLRLEDETGNVMPEPELRENFTLRFGDHDLFLPPNAAALTELGRSTPGNTLSLQLCWQADTPSVPFTAHHLTGTPPETL